MENWIPRKVKNELLRENFKKEKNVKNSFGKEEQSQYNFGEKLKQFSDKIVSEVKVQNDDRKRRKYGGKLELKIKRNEEKWKIKQKKNDFVFVGRKPI